jgi:DNA-binding SARP family transcriptional activator/TolB-like protein
MPLLTLSLFGGFDCRSAEGRPLALSTHKARALLAYLAVHAGQRHPRDKLAGFLWGDHSDVQARANLRKAISRLRQALPGPARGLVDLDAGGLMVPVGALPVDVARFETLALEGTPESLEGAARLHRGPFLEGIGECGESFDEWLMAERQRLDETLRQVLGRLLDHYLATGAVDRAIQIALRVLALDPLEEAVHRTLMRLYLQQDRLGAALEQYQRCRELLARELGVEPSPDTEALRGQILRMAPAGAPPRETDELPERPGMIEAGAEARARRRAQGTGRPSIVVLPFAAAEDGAGRPLGEGLAGDVATELGRFPELDIIAPATALAYRGVSVSPERVGAELGTAYVLDGSLRTSGDRLRVSARLLETATGRQLWAERYDCALTGLFDVQDEMVRHIVSTLVGRIERARLDVARRRPPGDREAYELWLQGWSALKRADLTAIRRARELFQQAAARDPSFARAYSGLALTLWTEWACFSWNPWVLMQHEAVDLARKAVELEDRDHRAHCILGVAQLYARDYEAARHHLLKAVELNPNDADVLAHVSFGMALVGEHALAVETGRSALRLQPHHPDWYAGMIGIALFGARLHEEAIQTMAPAPEAFCSAPAFLAAAYAHLGRAAESTPYRATVYRHYRHRLARQEFAEGTSCLTWLLGIDPFRLAADVDHYAEGLRKAGFE